MPAMAGRHLMRTMRRVGPPRDSSTFVAKLSRDGLALAYPTFLNAPDNDMGERSRSTHGFGPVLGSLCLELVAAYAIASGTPRIRRSDQQARRHCGLGVIRAALRQHLKAS